ncbi:MAG: ATP-binding protein, partial [Deltaproteobacteria bacterium]|nr:ATP-binding protein [Deltaproteobacteria bacterium]
ARRGRAAPDRRAGARRAGRPPSHRARADPGHARERGHPRRRSPRAADRAREPARQRDQVLRRAEVEVIGRSEGRHYVLEVRDRGIGIARRDLKRIFQRFYRVPEEAVRSRHGTGLGLFVVAALVQGMGGKIEAESPGPGQGSTFRVRLPLDRTERTTEERVVQA